MQYSNYQQLLDICHQTNQTISEIALKQEVERSQKTEQVLLDQMLETFKVMEDSAMLGIKQSLSSLSGLSGGDSVKLNDVVPTLLGVMQKDAIAFGLAVNELSAAQGKIVACPTAGSCGILPGALIAYLKHNDVPEQKVLLALFTAGAIGQIIEENACVSGAEGGCQAECGTAAAMAAGVLVDLSGGNADQIIQAATLAIKNLLGLACDPVAGLVEVPCVKRNGILSAYSFIAAEMALAGIKSAIPPDEVVEAMYKIGRMMPSAIRETAEGGLATTPTGLKWKSKIIAKVAVE